MSVDLRAGIVRVTRPDGGTAGTGFVVTDTPIRQRSSWCVIYCASGVRFCSFPIRRTNF